jgi:hypothetical protein
MLAFGIFMVALGFRKHEQKRWISKSRENFTFMHHW